MLSCWVSSSTIHGYSGTSTTVTVCYLLSPVLAVLGALDPEDEGPVVLEKKTSHPVTQCRIAQALDHTFGLLIMWLATYSQFK